MSKLERWLPFKFRRRKNPSKEAAETPPAQAPSGSNELAPRVPPWFQTPLSRMFQSFFDDPFFREPFAAPGDVSRWFGDFSPARFDPRIDVVDEEDGLRLTAELPGLDRDDVTLELDGGNLVIHGEKRNEHESTENGVYRSERYFGTFRRVLPLPADLDVDGAQATFSKGVLSVRFPKTSSHREAPRQIPVSG